MNNYENALEAAGATVHAFEEFGSCQGDWWAKVSYAGRVGWVKGSYGSCSGCDAFEAEFGWHDDRCEDHAYESDAEAAGCAACAEKREEYAQRVREFGASYLDDILSQEEAVKKASENLDWDCDAQAMVDFINENAEDK